MPSFSHIQTKSLLQKKNGLVSPDWHMTMSDTIKDSCVHTDCPGHAGVQGNDRADTETGRQSKHHKWIALLKIWSVEEHGRDCGHKAKYTPHHQPSGGESYRKRQDCRRTTLRGRRQRLTAPSSIRPTDPKFPSHCGNLWEIGRSVYFI